MRNKLLLKTAPLMTTAMLLAILVAPVLATGAHLWFYSVDPATLPGGYPPLVNPEGNDPHYVGPTSDPWTTESVVVPSGDWETPFSIWLGNADPHDTSYDTTVVISYNDAAAAAIDNMSVASTGFPLTPSDPADFPLPPHGVSTSPEWYGFQCVNVGDIPSGGYIEINIDINLHSGANVSEAKIHLDALGWSTEEHSTDLRTYDIFSPFSHDFTFVVPEPAIIVTLVSSLGVLGTYAYKRKKQ